MSKPSRAVCECADPGCPEHKGRSYCLRSPITHVIYRVDMMDTSGTAMCPQCADDALESGLYADPKGDAP